MKKLFLLLFVASFAFVSCDENEDPQTYQGDSLTYFADGTTSTFFVEENATEGYKIPVGVTDKAATDRTFTVSVDADLTTATPDQYSVGTSFVIPANEHIGYIEVQGNYDNIALEGSILALKLESIEGSNIADFDNVYQLKLSQFCPFDIALEYNGTASIVGQGPVNSYDVELVPTGNLNEYNVATIWGDFVAAATGNPDYAGEYQYSGVLSIDCLAEVTYSSDEGGLPGGTGNYNEATGNITIILNQELFTNPFQIEVVLTPKN